jgi:hypothetical protein
MATSMGPGISTISACTLEKVCGDHMFKIDGYSVCKGLGIGKFISSAIFTVGGHAWRLRYYPDGDMELSKRLRVCPPRAPDQGRGGKGAVPSDAGGAGHTVVNTLDVAKANGAGGVQNP